MDTWRIKEESYNPKINKNFEGLFTQGNGYLSIRGSIEEDLSGATQNDRYWRMPANVTIEKQRHPKSKWGVYVPGIVGNHPILNEEMVNLPYVLGLNLYIDNVKLDMEESEVENCSRELDLKTAILSRKLTWKQGTSTLELNFSRYTSMERKNLVVQELRIKASDGDTSLRVESFIEGDVTTNGYDHFVENEVWHNENINCRVKTDLGDEVVMLSKLLLPENSWGEYEVINKRVIQRAVIYIPMGDEVIITKLSIIKTSKDGNGANLMKDAGAKLYEALNNLERLRKEHAWAWERRWEVSDIEIEGDDRAQLAVRFSIYHLLRAVNEQNDRIAIDAKGAAGEAYFGHYFWDTEIYLLPFYLYINPEAARNLLMFRFNTLEAAKQNAVEYGYRGAKYPWESSNSGLEQCSNWQYKDLEVHISADIVYAMWNYVMVTGDTATLFDKFIDVMYEVSRFWIERMYREKDGTYSIKGVMGPDEYLAFTDNNAFTNYMVRHCLVKTLETLEMIKSKDEELYSEKVTKLNITEEEINMMEEVSENINIPIDYENHFIWQCDAFDRFEDIDFDRVWTDRGKPFGQFISQERNYRSKALKQADVIGLLYLFKKDFERETVENCMEYYEPITTHDSSLSYIIHSIVYSQLGNRERAYDYFAKSLGIDLYDNGAAEGIHIANCGGVWQAVIFGFCGLNNLMFDDEIELNPMLPQNWKRVSFKVVHRNKLYCITVTQDKVEINMELGVVV